LIVLVREQDADAFEVIFDRHSGPAYSLAYRMCGERSLAEDVVQETFLNLWRGVGSYQAGRGSLRNWLLTAVRNRMIDSFRSRAAKQSSDVSDEGLSEMLAGISDTHAQVEAREERTQVHEALLGLPEEQRVVVELAFFRGLSHTEIAELLKLPAGTVKGRMRLALEKLRRELPAPVGSVL